MTEIATDGFLFNVAVCQTPDKGLGVFAQDAIARDSIVWRHTPGQFKVYDEPSFMALINPMSPDEVVYELTHVFGLADFPSCLIRIRDAGVLINHDYNANLATNFARPMQARPDTTRPGYLDAVALALLEDRFALRATRDIAPGEELTNNYDQDVFDPPFFLRLYAQYGVEEDYF